MSKITTDESPSNKQVMLGNIEKDTEENENFRRVYYTAPDDKMQIVLMKLDPHQDIGWESHPNDQFFRIEVGSVMVSSDYVSGSVGPGGVVVIPAGTNHNIAALDVTVKLYTIYAPAHHPRGLVQATK